IAGQSSAPMRLPRKRAPIIALLVPRLNDDQRHGPECGERPDGNLADAHGSPKKMRTPTIGRMLNADRSVAILNVLTRSAPTMVRRGDNTTSASTPPVGAATFSMMVVVIGVVLVSGFGGMSCGGTMTRRWWINIAPPRTLICSRDEGRVCTANSAEYV